MLLPPNLCCSAGLWESSRRGCRVSATQGAQALGPDRTDVEDRGVLGKDPTWFAPAGQTRPARARCLQPHPRSLPASTEPQGALLQAPLPSLPPGCWRRPWRGCASPVTLRSLSLQLQQDRGRVEEYLQQSQPYLKATQTNLRLEAVRFIGEPSPWVPLGAAFGSPRHCPGSEAQPCCPQSPPTGPLLQGAGGGTAWLARPGAALLGACWGAGL